MSELRILALPAYVGESPFWLHPRYIEMGRTNVRPVQVAEKVNENGQRYEATVNLANNATR